MSIKEYRRNWYIFKKYNMTQSEFEGYWNDNYGKCYICGKLMKYPESKQGQGLDVVAIDHNHVTGEIRGLLCNICNRLVLPFLERFPHLQNDFIKQYLLSRPLMPK